MYHASPTIAAHRPTTWVVKVTTTSALCSVASTLPPPTGSDALMVSTTKAPQRFVVAVRCSVVSISEEKDRAHQGDTHHHRDDDGVAGGNALAAGTVGAVSHGGSGRAPQNHRHRRIQLRSNLDQ